MLRWKQKKLKIIKGPVFSVWRMYQLNCTKLLLNFQKKVWFSFISKDFFFHVSKSDRKHRILYFFCSKIKYVHKFKMQHIFMQCIEAKLIKILWILSLLQWSLMNFYPRKTFPKNLCHHQFAMISIFPEMKFRRTTIYRIKVRSSLSLLIFGFKSALCSMHKVNNENNVVAFYYRFFEEIQQFIQFIRWGFSTEFVIPFIIFIWCDWCNSVIINEMYSHVWILYVLVWIPKIIISTEYFSFCVELHYALLFILNVRCLKRMYGSIIPL